MIHTTKIWVTLFVEGQPSFFLHWILFSGVHLEIGPTNAGPEISGALKVTDKLRLQLLAKIINSWSELERENHIIKFVLVQKYLYNSWTLDER